MARGRGGGRRSRAIAGMANGSTGIQGADLGGAGRRKGEREKKKRGRRKREGEEKERETKKREGEEKERETKKREEGMG